MNYSSVALAEVAIINPPTPQTLSESEEVAFIPMAAVNSDLIEVESSEMRLARDVRNGFTYFENGDVLVAKITPCFENGKIALTRLRQQHGFGSTEFHVIRPVGGKLDPRFLVHYLRQDRLRIEGARKMTGSAGQKRVPKHFLEKLSISLPPIDEQRRIAAILDAADALCAKRRAAITKLDTLTQSIFRQMFGDWSKPDSNRRMFKIGDRLDFLTSGSRGWATYYRESGSLFLRIQNVRRDELSLDDVAFVDPPQTAEADRTRVCSGDVLLSITADLGRTAVVPDGIGEAFINQHLSILRSSKIIPRYLSAALRSPSGQRSILMKNREGVKAGLNFDDIRSIEIPNVDLAEQQRFANLAQNVDALKMQHRTAQNHLNKLFLSLQHRAFRGEL
jgi:type I restriction enzyme S subunit